MWTPSMSALLLALASAHSARANLADLHTPLLNELEPCVAENILETDHYICSDDHKVICLDGWSDPENKCRIPVCEFVTEDTLDLDDDGDTTELITKTCDHGDCIRPGVCACCVGWEGRACDECIRMPGCREGYCTEAFGCTCHNETLYRGSLCDCPVCKAGCVHGYCDEPGQCICDAGWEGELCDRCVRLPGCQHGTCDGFPLSCRCKPGWTGPLCDCPVCKEGCNLDHGFCTNAVEDRLFECLCQPGWEGDDCDRCVKYPGCPAEATCDKPWECVCPEGVEHELCGVCREDTNILPNYFHFEMSNTCLQMNREFNHEGAAGSAEEEEEAADDEEETGPGAEATTEQEETTTIFPPDIVNGDAVNEEDLSAE